MVQENADIILTQGELTQRNDSPKNENVLLIVLTLRPSKMYAQMYAHASE